MTYAPISIAAIARYWVSQGGTNLGIVGDTRHAAKGRSYHLGRSQLTADAYSRQTTRDQAGLTEASSALDLGKLNGNLGQLRAFSRWFVERCRSNAPGTSDVREFIYSPDGIRVLRWDRERGVKSAPRAGEADVSHLGHSHVSFYRDSERRAKVGLFTPYFVSRKAPSLVPTATIARLKGYIASLEAVDEPTAAQLAKLADYRVRLADYSSRGKET